MFVKSATTITPEELKSIKKSRAIRKGKKTAALALDDAIERALEKDRF
tara:strand:- start:6 stop:149 length:144 start_codon:yes stop_codon:yes gene_type:complete